MLVTGLAMATSVRVSNSLGAGCPRTARRATFTALCLTSCLEASPLWLGMTAAAAAAAVAAAAAGGEPTICLPAALFPVPCWAQSVPWGRVSSWAGSCSSHTINNTGCGGAAVPACAPGGACQRLRYECQTGVPVRRWWRHWQSSLAGGSSPTYSPTLALWWVLARSPPPALLPVWNVVGLHCAAGARLGSGTGTASGGSGTTSNLLGQAVRHSVRHHP